MITDINLPISLNKINSIKTFGNSMMPVLFNGDVIYLRIISFQKIKINDIIAVRKKNQFFTHRVLYKTPKYLITKGDNNTSSDGKIYSKNIVGIVNKVKRNGVNLNIQDIYLMQSTLYFHEIIKVKKVLEIKKIAHIILKGLPLHLFYEGQIPQKIYSDCDVLIFKNQFEKVRKVLKSLGYKEIDSSFTKTQKNLKKHETEISFYKIINGIPIYFDIHLEAVFLMTQIGNLNSLYPKKLLDEFSVHLLSEIRPIKALGEDINILNAENLFIYLILHLYHHNFKGAYRYDLIKKIVAKEKLDYSQIAATINKFKLNNFIFPGIILLEKYYGLKFDKEFLNNIKPSVRILKIINSDLIGVNNQLPAINIFNDEDRVGAGIKRFRTLFELSPNKLHRKLLTFLNPEVVYFILWYLIKKTNKMFNNKFVISSP